MARGNVRLVVLAVVGVCVRCALVACRIPGGMVLAWNGCEFGWGIIKTDARGRKQWGSKYCAEVLATDGRRLFASGGHCFSGQKGVTTRMDVGYIFGNRGGTRAAARAYWRNNSFTANVTNDIPHESRLEPAQWGRARFE